MNPNSAYYELKFYTIGLCEECNLTVVSKKTPTSKFPCSVHRGEGGG